MRGLLAHGSQNRAIIWSAILFGIAHQNPCAISNSFYIGACLCLLGHPNGSLWPGILGHALNNFLSVTFLHFDVPGFPVSEDFNVVIHNPWWLNVCGPIVAAIGCGGFIRWRSAKKQIALKYLLNPRDILKTRRAEIPEDYTISCPSNSLCVCRKETL